VIWKATFEARSAVWMAFGRVLFVEAEDIHAAEDAARSLAKLEFPGMVFHDWQIQPSTLHAMKAFEAKRAKYAAWLERVRSGEPNTREDA
jgi:hypothetical protein